jgi:hypothetical protein
MGSARQAGALERGVTYGTSWRNDSSQIPRTSQISVRARWRLFLLFRTGQRAARILQCTLWPDYLHSDTLRGLLKSPVHGCERKVAGLRHAEIAGIVNRKIMFNASSRRVSFTATSTIRTGKACTSCQNRNALSRFRRPRATPLPRPFSISYGQMGGTQAMAS